MYVTISWRFKTHQTYMSSYRPPRLFGGRSTTTWTKFYPILTTYPPRVKNCGHFTYQQVPTLCLRDQAWTFHRPPTYLLSKQLLNDPYLGVQASAYTWELYLFYSVAVRLTELALLSYILNHFQAFTLQSCIFCLTPDQFKELDMVK